MSYRIVVDSCGEFTEEMAKDSHFVHAALNLEIDGNHFVDDETFDRLRFLIWWRKARTARNQAVRLRKSTGVHSTAELTTCMQ